MQGRLGHLTIAVDYFFNNDLEYLKTSDPEKTYTMSIMKTKAARYEIVGIKYMTPMLWSTVKHAYDKDAEKGVKKLYGYGHLEEIVVKDLIDSYTSLKSFRTGHSIKFEMSFITEYSIGIQQRDVKEKVDGYRQKRSKLMVELIDKQMRERQIIRNLERLVGDRELEMDYKLMTRTV
ncbi:hypothetical protein Tco_0116982 [Tanacetum coccineum]